MKILIKPRRGVWVLLLVNNDHLIKSFTFKRLIDAINTASELQLHVSNIAELPLTQYANQGG